MPRTHSTPARGYDRAGPPSSPTIVFVGGKEIGRLPAAAWVKPEAGLDGVLSGTAASGSR